MFRFLAVLGIAVALVMAGMHIRKDYVWAEKEISAETQGRWQIVDRQSIYSDPTYPWTLVVTPVTALYFMDPERIERHGPHLFLAPVMAKTYDYTHRKTHRHLFWAGFDLDRQRIAIFKADRDGLVVVQKEVAWTTIEPGSPAAGLASYVRKRQPAMQRVKSLYKST